MNVYKTRQSDLESVLDYKFDLFIACSGYETRARYLVEVLGSKIIAGRKYCIQFSNYKDRESRHMNDQTFSDFGFETGEYSGNESRFIFSILEELLQKVERNTLNILVDYSSMTRVWYASILQFFKYKVIEGLEVNIFFSYSSSKFVIPPKATIYNRYVGPIDGFYTITIPNKPTALIVGLGYIQSRAYGLAEFFDVDPYIFIADSSSNVEYFKEVMEKNDELIRVTKESNIFKYPLDNLLFTETLLYSLARDLRSDYRVVLAPCGPKPFTLLCLIIGQRLSGIDVWRISAGEDDVPVDKVASGYLNILQLVLR